MITAIAIGDISTSIVNTLKSFSNDIEDIIINKEKYPLKDNNTTPNMEDYENYFQNINFNINKSSSMIYCFIDGYDSIAGATLQILQNFGSGKITIFYITKDNTILSPIQKLNNKICINVLQEYTRSGLFEHMFIFNYDFLFEALYANEEISIGKSLLELKQIVIDKICTCVYSYHQTRTELVVDGNTINYNETIYRISTFFDLLDNGQIVPMFQLKFPKVYSYILCLPEKLNKEDLLLIKTLKSKIKSKNDDCDYYLSIFNDNNRSVIGFCSTNIVQESIYV